VHSLFPPGVAVAVRREPGDPADLLPGEAVYVAKAVPKRINEFAAGRACARRALATFGMPGGSCWRRRTASRCGRRASWGVLPIPRDSVQQPWRRAASYRTIPA
jgi:hypothetical protein